jgi:hypothetical protein
LLKVADRTKLLVTSSKESPSSGIRLTLHRVRPYRLIRLKDARTNVHIYRPQIRDPSHQSNTSTTFNCEEYRKSRKSGLTCSPAGLLNHYCYCKSWPQSLVQSHCGTHISAHFHPSTCTISPRGDRHKDQQTVSQKLTTSVSHPPLGMQLQCMQNTENTWTYDKAKLRKPKLYTRCCPANIMLFGNLEMTAYYTDAWILN